MPRGIIDFAPWDKEWVSALYDAQIRRMDTEFFGRLRRVLRKTGLNDNTVIVITADHGEELLEHGLVGHVSTFKEASRRGVDLQLSGHTHAGQIWPFRYLVRLSTPFVEGIHRKGSATVYVSRGTGFWGPPMRLGAPAEITELCLRRAS